MNKQEAIEKQSTQAYDDFAIMRDTAIHIINQIDEPQKVTVPKFVAEWLEYCKIAYHDLQMVLSRLDYDMKVRDWAYDENDDLIPDKVDMIASAWIDGYEIEQEFAKEVEEK